MVFVTDRTFSKTARDIMTKSEVAVSTKTIFAGKLRRYHTVKWYRQLLDLPTTLQNVRDVLLVGVGLVQSWWMLGREKPDAVFTKGGFVCLPIGLAAHIRRIPLVIHDSDSHPGLTNRLLSRYATVIATGAPLENYPYDPAKSHYVGIPVSTAFRPVGAKERQDAKDALGFPDTTWPVVVVTGGGLGAARINTAMLLIADQLIDRGIGVYHIAGTGQVRAVAQKAPKHPAYIVRAFDQHMDKVFAAADVVVSRAGATALAEISAASRPLIIVPSRLLSAGHQLKNAAVYEKQGAAVVLDEQQIEHAPADLLQSITHLIDHPAEAMAMAERLHKLAKPQAAAAMAALIAKAYAYSREVGEGE